MYSRHLGGGRDKRDRSRMESRLWIQPPGRRLPIWRAAILAAQRQISTVPLGK